MKGWGWMLAWARQIEAGNHTALVLRQEAIRDENADGICRGTGGLSELVSMIRVENLKIDDRHGWVPLC